MLWRLGEYTVILHTPVPRGRRGPPQCAAAAHPHSEAKLQLFCPCLAVTAARCALYWQRLTLALVGAPHASKGLSPNSSKEDSGFLHVATASIVMHGAHWSRTENQCIKLREEPKWSNNKFLKKIQVTLFSKWKRSHKAICNHQFLIDG